MPYDPKAIEPKWQKYWEERGLYRAEDFSQKEKKYVLDMFPYPSGEGLHVGHAEGYTATDVLARFFRMRGENVLHPMGWDAFGLPAENHAIQTQTHPRIVVEKNVAHFRNQLKRLGFSYDWSREINTTDPAYYRWTQWIFLQLFKKGLAYEAEASINFCPKDKTGLANEEVVGGKCERCGTEVEKRTMRQWMLRITAYADRLLDDLETLSWPERIKEMQRNWIGRSEGADVLFTLKDTQGRTGDLRVFTTRPDTLFGATYVVVAPEHPLLAEQGWRIENRDAVTQYCQDAQRRSELERQEAREKTGIKLEGIVAVNPVNGEALPIFVADYVLGHYGTGAIMAVPAHDERDFAFATARGLPFTMVICPHYPEKTCPVLTEAFVGEGHLVASGQFDGMSDTEARDAITAWLSERGRGEKKIQYKLRDWIFSRQRFWGEPIPLVHCPVCGIVPVPEDQLPVLLPEVKHYEPTGTGESPLAAVESWINIACPKCGGPARRETNTMPQWAGSCWYYFRFLDPQNNSRFVDETKEAYWMPADIYVGGAEHAVLHLLYARFWHKVLFDLGFASTPEPFTRLVNQGLILGPDNQKMSKSRGNIINPDKVIEQFGADTLRLYELFMGPLETEKPWDTKGIVGIWRFLKKAYAVVVEQSTGETDERIRHKTIKKVTDDIIALKFNTAISAMMEWVNALGRGASDEDKQILPLLLAPFAPHLAEELWQVVLRQHESIHEHAWPTYDPTLVEEDTAIIVVQVNGRTRGQMVLRRGATETETRRAAGEDPKVAKHVEGRVVKKIVFVPDRLINFVLEEQNR